ncbi:hypothetical protein ON010_g7153 [Phytophthora cinnamomi]|nr:hypothetical protein ON010_g7153 [Phytophthora cinnamomi]
MTTKRAEVLLGNGNYFHWEYNMRMMLARNGLLADVEVVKAENEITEAWLTNDAKALGIIAHGAEIQHQTKIRSATRAMQAWNTLREYYNRTTLHNRVVMTWKLHEFKMEAGTVMAKHLDAFDELIGGRGNGRKGNGPRKNGGFKDKCFQCDQVGHKKRDCEGNNGGAPNDEVFTVGEERFTGWLIDSGASSHMTPHREDPFDFEGTETGDRGRKETAGRRKKNGQADRNGRRLLSVGKLAERGLSAEFQRSSYVIWGKASTVALDNKVGKAYVLDCEQESARLVEYAGADSQWELWHAHMGHPGENAMAETQRATSGEADDETVPVTVEDEDIACVGASSHGCDGADENGLQGSVHHEEKSEVASKLIECKAFYENQWGERLKCLRSDNGTEIVNKTVTELRRWNGIMHQRTVPYSPQQNGVAERMNRAVLEKARSMLHYKGVSTEWWAEAVSTAVYLINRSTNTERSDMTPYEVVFKVKPQLEHLRVFGSPGYAHIDDAERTKLEPKSFRCVFLGYAENAKGYRVYDMDASKVKVSRSVKLSEREDGDAPTVPVETDRQPVEDEPVEAVEEPVQDVEVDEAESEEEVLRLPPPERPATVLELTAYRPPPQAFLDDRLVFHPEPVRATRSQEPVFLLGNGDDEARKSEDSDGSPSPKRPRIDEDGLIAEAVMAYAARITEATDVPETYTLVPRETDKCTIGSWWVFAKKRDENGRVIRYKARLVAKGFRLKYVIDFFETYSPVVNMNLIRVVLAVCVADGYVMEQLDADTSFLNSDLTDLVYMEIPLGIGNSDDNICVLNNAIYSLKQAASAWNKTFHRVFLKNGFKSCGADQCGYVKRSKYGYVYVRLYVDDMIIAAKTSNEIREVKDALKNAFKMKELGTAKFILGMDIDPDKTVGTLMIKQTRSLWNASSPGTVKERAEMRSRPYCSLIGYLLYVMTCTRPDSAYVVTQLSWFPENPSRQHCRAAIRVLRYLKPSREHGIMYQRGDGNVTVEAFAGADWGSNVGDRRSVSGVMVRIGNGPVVFKSKFQRTVALSSAKAEYMALIKRCSGRNEASGYSTPFIRENVERGTAKVDYIGAKHQLADMLTKALETSMLKYLRIKANATVQ